MTDRLRLLDYVAPCSLLCFNCLDSVHGAIPECVAKLCKYLDGFYNFNNEDLSAPPDKFAVFYRELEGLAKPRCPGCRNGAVPGSGCVEDCVVPSCVKEHNVDYCADCHEFPCQTAKSFFSEMNDSICNDWLNGNMRIKEIGIENYFDERKDASHYKAYPNP